MTWRAEPKYLTTSVILGRLSILPQLPHDLWPLGPLIYAVETYSRPFIAFAESTFLKLKKSNTSPF